MSTTQTQVKPNGKTPPPKMTDEQRRRDRNDKRNARRAAAREAAKKPDAVQAVRDAASVAMVDGYGSADFSTPAGDGSVEIAIGKSEEEALARMVENEDEGDSAKAVASRFLVGELLRALKSGYTRLATYGKQWPELNEREQSDILRDATRDVRAAVGKSVKCIASDNRQTFAALCESVTFKDGVKAVLTLPKGGNAHDLAECAGQNVLIVLEDGSDYLNADHEDEPDPDQKPLFDASQAAARAEAADAPITTTTENAATVE
jgi:hypothetical protein